MRETEDAKRHTLRIANRARFKVNRILRTYTYRLKIHFTKLFIRKFFKIYATAAKSLQSCLTLCDPIDGSPPGSPVPGILQAKRLKRVAISFSNA